MLYSLRVGTGGLRRAVSLAFLEEGAKVVVTFRKQEEYVALKSAAGAKGESLEGHLVDVTDEMAVGQLVDQISTRSERLDAVVNTIGGGRRRRQAMGPRCQNS
jgi:NAD(P)-dependent dehydrogenase (short-subunit alcohol dehydrogenase family)